MNPDDQPQNHGATTFANVVGQGLQKVFQDYFDRAALAAQQAILVKLVDTIEPGRAAFKRRAELSGWLRRHEHAAADL
eukprot:20894-Eustigmatos_ZCMA.PRE.1